MNKKNLPNCPDCNVKVGEIHQDGCDLERCPSCGGQLLSCSCADDEVSKFKPIPWEGEFPGLAECRKFGLYCKMVSGTGRVTCNKNEPGAEEDLNRLYSQCQWNSETQSFEPPQSENNEKRPSFTIQVDENRGSIKIDNFHQIDGLTINFKSEAFYEAIRGFANKLLAQISTH